MKVAVAAAGAGGLDDTVSPVFEASPSFTPVDVDNQEIVSVEVIVNRTNCVIGAAAADLSQDLVGRDVRVGRHQHVPSSGYAGSGCRQTDRESCDRHHTGRRAGSCADGLRRFHNRGCRPRQPGEDGQGAALAPPSRNGDLLPPGPRPDLHLS